MKKFQITFKGQVYELDVEEIGSSVSAPAVTKTASAPAPAVATPTPAKADASKSTPAPASAQTIIAPIPGKILRLNVQKGDSVKRGDLVCILEAMKMQNEIMANQDGTIVEIQVAVGQSVSTGNVLMTIG